MAMENDGQPSTPIVSELGHAARYIQAIFGLGFVWNQLAFQEEEGGLRVYGPAGFVQAAQQKMEEYARGGYIMPSAVQRIFDAVEYPSVILRPQDVPGEEPSYDQGPDPLGDNGEGHAERVSLRESFLIKGETVQSLAELASSGRVGGSRETQAQQGRA